MDRSDMDEEPLNDIETASGPPAVIAERDEKPVGASDLTARTATLHARDIRLSPYVTVDELKLTGEDIQINTGPAGSLKISNLAASLIVTESALNRLLMGRVEDQLRNLQVRMMNGKVRIEGKYSVFPFTFTAVPEIEGGARLRLDPRHMSFVGLPIPGVGTQVIGEKINARLASGFDLTRFAMPLRLTSLTVETGRLILTAQGEVELSSTGRTS